jgi:anti-sigma factor RsiW
MSCPEFEVLLDPYVDGELPIPEVLATERHLADCAACRSKYEDLEWLRAEIKAARLDYVPSPELTRTVRKLGARDAEPRRSWMWGVGLLAAALAAILLVPRVWVQPDHAGREILDSHLRSLLASNLVDVPSSDRHTVKPWFQGRLGFSPAVPDLSQDGFVLLGGRLEVIEQQRAAALVYKRREHVINLFIAEGRAAGTERSSQEQGYNVTSWTDRGLSYWAISDLNAQELSSFAHLIRAKQ